jgi:hypothetical protein
MSVAAAIDTSTVIALGRGGVFAYLGQFLILFILAMEWNERAEKTLKSIPS